MNKQIMFFVFYLFLIPPVAAQPENWKFVRDKTAAKLQELVGSVRGAMGLSVLDLTSGERFAINSGLPGDIAVAFKPGSIPGVSTEWAIVYLEERPYIVVVMENYAMGDEAAAAMKEISRTLYDYFWRLGNATRHGTYVDPALIK